MALDDVYQNQDNEPLVALTEKCWIANDGVSVVPDGDEDASILLGLAGDEIPQSLAVKLGMMDDPEEVRKMKVGANQNKMQDADQNKSLEKMNHEELDAVHAELGLDEWEDNPTKAEKVDILNAALAAAAESA